MNLRESRDVDDNGSCKANKKNQRSTDLASVAILGLYEAPLKAIAHETGTAIGEEVTSLLLLTKGLLRLAKEALFENALSESSNTNSSASSEDLALREKKLDFKSTSNDATSDFLDVLEDHGSRLGEGSRTDAILNRREDVATSEFDFSPLAIAFDQLQVVNVDSGGSSGGFLLLGNISSTIEVVKVLR